MKMSYSSLTQQFKAEAVESCLDAAVDYGYSIGSLDPKVEHKLTVFRAEVEKMYIALGCDSTTVKELSGRLKELMKPE